MRSCWFGWLVMGMTLLATGAAAAPVKVILDTDIGPDCDDVGALTVLHALADRGEAELLATVCCTSSPWGAPCLDALNTWFGRPEIAVGTLKERGFLVDSGYPQVVARLYPHRLTSGDAAPDAVDVYRRVLAAQPDSSVVVVAVGPLRNLRHLLASPADARSPLDGRALVAAKVRRLACMGGAYPASRGDKGEWNFAQDGSAARATVEGWPTPITFSGGELGGGLMTGRRAALDCPEYAPLPTAYGLYIGYGRDRESWDLTAALVGIRGPGEVWSLSPPGANRVDDQGRNTFAADPAGRHDYLVRRTPAQPTEDLLEDLLVSARPGRIALDYDLTLFAKDGFGQLSAEGGEYGPETAARAADRSTGTVWYGGDRGCRLRFDTADGRAWAVTSYTLDTRDRQPRSWELQGSTDHGASWLRLDQRTDQPAADDAGPRRFAVDNVNPYASYRLVFAPGQKVPVAEWSLFARVERVPGRRVTNLALDRPRLTLRAHQRQALNARALPDDAFEQQVTWTSSDAAVATVARIGEHTGMVQAVGPGSCEVTASSADGQTRATARVEVEPSSLPAGWRFEAINGPHVPGAAAYADGVFTVTGGGMGIGRWWQRNWDQFVLLSQTREGDAAITARIGAPSPSSPGALAGLMFRESTDRESGFVAVGLHPSGEAILTWRNSPADENPRTKLGRLTTPAFVRLARQGTRYAVYTSADGVAWGQPVATHDGPAMPLARVGLWVTADRNPTTSRAAFDQVEVAPAAR